MDNKYKTATFGFGLRATGAYLYLTVSDERLEAPVTERIGPIKSITSYSDGFITFSCDLSTEEYADFHEYAELQGVLDKWESLFKAIKEVQIRNEL